MREPKLKENFERIWKVADKRFQRYKKNPGKFSIGEAQRIEDEQWTIAMLRIYMERDGIKLKPDI